MPRWRQDSKTGELIRIDGEAQKQKVSGLDSGGGIFPGAKPFEAFVSPVDGSLIRNGRELEDHNRRNGVVSANEFSDDYYKRKADERARVLNAQHSREEQYRRRQEIYNAIVRAERNER